MRRNAKAALLLCSLLTASAMGAQKKFIPSPELGVPGKYLVVLGPRVVEVTEEGTREKAVGGAIADFRTRFDFRPVQIWSGALAGFSMKASEAEAKRLAEDPDVLFVEQDQAFPVDALLSAVPWCTALAPSCLSPNDPLSVTSLLYNNRAFPSSPQILTCANTNPSVTPNCIDNWGIDRSDQPNLPRNQMYTFAATGAGVHLYIIDTGIKSTHREVSGRVGAGYDATGYGSLDDCACHHHGTAVASLAAGATYGVAKGATLHPVRVVNLCGGYVGGTTSEYVSAFNWIAQNHQSPAVANLSGANLTSLVTSPSFVAAARGLIQSGVSFVQSAGNQGEDASSYSVTQPDPTYNVANAIVAGASIEIDEGGSIDGRWVADATDPSHQDTVWHTGYCKYSNGALKPLSSRNQCGSNYGSSIAIWAPGAWTVSAGWDNTQTADSAFCQMSGTSMAAPHVAGVLALYLQSHPTATPQQAKAALLAAGKSNVLQTSGTWAIKSGSPNLLLQVIP